MWPNGFGSNGDFPNNFSRQDDYSLSPFGAGPGGQYFPKLPFQQNMMPFEGGNGERFMNNDFQPEVGLYNEGAFSQTQFVNAANPQVSYCSLPSKPFCHRQCYT